MAHQIQLVTVLAAIGLVLICSCASETGTLRSAKVTVIVTDNGGQPIENAEVYSVSASMTVGPHVTNTLGEATVPHNLQESQWVRVVAAGYQVAQYEVSRQETLRVVLQPAKADNSLAAGTRE